MDDELGLLLDPQSLFPHRLSAEISQLPVPSVVSGKMKKLFIGRLVNIQNTDCRIAI